MKVYNTLIVILLIHTECLNGDGGIIQDFYWRDFVPGYIPYDAIEEGNGRYIGQVIVAGFTMPAMIYPHLTAAAVTVYNKKEITKDNIKILCSPDPSRFYWERVDFTVASDGQMNDVLKCGYQDNENMFAGKVLHDEEWKIGKVYDIHNPKFSGLWIWDKADKPLRIFNFDILKYNSTILGCV